MVSALTGAAAHPTEQPPSTAVCDEAKEQTAVGPALAAYRLEDTYGPDPTMMRANCLVQTTEWSACSKTVWHGHLDQGHQ